MELRTGRGYDGGLLGDKMNLTQHRADTVKKDADAYSPAMASAPSPGGNVRSSFALSRDGR